MFSHDTCNLASHVYQPKHFYKELEKNKAVARKQMRHGGTAARSKQKAWKEHAT